MQYCSSPVVLTTALLPFSSTVKPGALLPYLQALRSAMSRIVRTHDDDPTAVNSNSRRAGVRPRVFNHQNILWLDPDAHWSRPYDLWLRVVLHSATRDRYLKHTADLWVPNQHTGVCTQLCPIRTCAVQNHTGGIQLAGITNDRYSEADSGRHHSLQVSCWPDKQSWRYVYVSAGGREQTPPPRLC